MKTFPFILMLLALAVSCRQPATQPAAIPQVISPLPSGIDLSHLTDATVAAGFTMDSFNWTDGRLSMTVFSETRYDAVDVHLMKPGDTLLYDNQKLVVDTIAESYGGLSVNGGLEAGGAWLQPDEGGTWKAVQFDDHSVYVTLGQITLPLDDNYLFIDCGDMPDDPADTIRTGLQQYLQQQSAYRQTFSCLNTRVQIEDGRITCITRRWIP